MLRIGENGRRVCGPAVITFCTHFIDGFMKGRSRSQLVQYMCENLVEELCWGVKRKEEAERVVGASMMATTMTEANVIHLLKYSSQSGRFKTELQCQQFKRYETYDE